MSDLPVSYFCYSVSFLFISLWVAKNSPVSCVLTQIFFKVSFISYFKISDTITRQTAFPRCRPHSSCSWCKPDAKSVRNRGDCADWCPIRCFHCGGANPRELWSSHCIQRSLIVPHCCCSAEIRNSALYFFPRESGPARERTSRFRTGVQVGNGA